MKQFAQTIIAWVLMLTPLYPQTAEWQQTNGPLGGDVNALVMADTGTLIAGTRFGGLFRSTDDGQTWNHLQDSPSAPFLFNGVWDMTKNSQGHLFAATSRGVYRSTDNGDSWTAFDTGLTDRFIQALAINSIDVIFAGSSSQGIFRSEDNGETWTAFNNGLTALDVESVAINSLGDVFAGTTDGVFFSNDNGDNWTEVSNGLENKNILTIFVTPEDSLLAATFNGAFRSSDHGANWTKLAGVFGLVHSFARNSANVLFAGSSFFFRSPDNGVSWSQTLSESLPFALFADLYVTPAQKLISAMWNYGILSSSDNGDTWQQNVGLTTVDVVALTQTPGGTIFAGGRDDGIFRTSDGGATWELLLEPAIGLNVRAMASSDAGRLFVSVSGNLALSEDNGDTWTVADSSLSERFAESIAFGNANDVYVGFYGKIFKSADGGDTWSELPGVLPVTTIQALAVAADGTVFAGTRDNGVLRSTDAGSTWVEVNSGLGHNFDMTAFLFLPNGDLLVSGFDGMFRSSDNGDTWVTQGTVPILGVKDLVSDSAGNLFIAMRGVGVAVSEDDGATWTSINSGLWHKDAKALLIDDGDNIYVGTRGGSVFKTQFLPTSVERTQDGVPETFVLEQNYPNPFNPSTQITFALVADSKVTLQVYNLLGQIVATLIKNEFLSAGRHKLQFQAEQLPGGIYFYRFKTENFFEVKKMTLLK